MGPPGSGKGTQATRLSAALDLQHISVGDVLREEVAAGSAVGVRAAAVMETGALMPDELVTELIATTITKAAAGNGYILDGYPRSKPQATALLEGTAGTPAAPDIAIALMAPEAELVQRLLRRAELENRLDDNPEVIANRLLVYRESTEPVLAVLREHGLLHVVEADGDEEAIASRVLDLVRGTSTRAPG
jgi:adenylate kinase